MKIDLGICSGVVVGSIPSVETASDGTVTKRNTPYRRDVRATLYIDVDHLVRQLLHKAARSKGRKAKEAKGAIVLKVVLL